MSNRPSAVPPSIAYADTWVEKLREKLPEVTKTWDAEAIHHSRVATRRLRAAVDVLAPVLSKSHRKRLARVLRKLRRQLGPLRDLDVMLGHLAKFHRTPGVEWLQQQLDDERTDHRDDVADALLPTRVLAKLGEWWAVRQEWAEAGDAVDGLLANSVHLQLDAFAEAATSARQGGRDRDPHQLRIAGKALRYTLEMAVESGHPLPAAVAKAFKRMQDALGAWHDMVVLAERAIQAMIDAQLAYHDPALFLSVTDVARAAVQRSQRHLSAFESLWAKEGEPLAATIRATFPIARDDGDAPLIEPSADRDRPGSPGTSGPAAPAPGDPATA